MDNQNTNGLNGLNRNSEVNVNSTGTQMPEVPKSNGNTAPIIGGSSSAPVNQATRNEGVIQQSPVEPVPPVKPTLDSILNGAPSMESQSIEPNTTSTISPTPVEARPVMEEPINTLVSNTDVVSDTPIVDNSAATMNSGMQVPPVQSVNSSEPIVETIPANVAPTMSNIGEQVANLGMSPSTTEGLAMKTKDALSTPEIVSLNANETPIEVNQSIEQPINIETLDTNIPGEIPQDDFGAVPIPPEFDDGKKKKEKKERVKGDNKKTIIVLLLFVLVIAIGFGVYYFLTMAKASANKASIVLKDVKLELGSTMSTNIEDYATITGYDKANCTIDLANVSLDKVSTYKYTVTCGKQTQEGIVIVDDSMPPKATVNDVILTPNATLNAEDFIEKCMDASSCSYRFAEDYSGLTEKIGEYEVQIIVSDNFNNEATVSAKLIVSRTAPVKYLTCTAKEEVLEDIPATLVQTYRIGIDANDTFYNSVRTSLFTYKTLEDYNNAIRNYDETIGINGVVGTETFNDADKTISIKANKTLNDMNQDLNGKLPSNANVIRAYLSGLGFTCN